MYVINRKFGESVVLELPDGTAITIATREPDGARARLAIDAPQAVRITPAEDVPVDCPDCYGEGGFIVDGFDPGSRYGHTQITKECRRCDGSGGLTSGELTDKELEDLKGGDK